MKSKTQIFEFKDDEKKQAYLREVIAFFEEERGEEIGFIAAEEVLDFFLTTIGVDIYKKAIKDSQKMLREKLEEIDINLELLISERKQ